MSFVGKEILTTYNVSYHRQPSVFCPLVHMVGGVIIVPSRDGVGPFAPWTWDNVSMPNDRESPPWNPATYFAGSMCLMRYRDRAWLLSVT
jgi:hypothetical protein